MPVGLSRKPDSRRKPTRRGPLDRLSLDDSAFGAEDPFGVGDSTYGAAGTSYMLVEKRGR